MTTNDDPTGATPQEQPPQAPVPAARRRREPRPGCPPAPALFEDVDLHICGSCFELRRPRQKGNQEAADWCACDWNRGMGPKPGTPGNHLRGMYRLCWSCAAAVTVGCSKFSLHVCKPCMTEIQETSAALGRRIAPIGRHSIHHGVGLRTDLPYVHQDLVDLANGLNSMVSSVSAADKHRRARTAELAHRFGLFGQERIDLWEYLAYCVANGVGNEGVASLVKFSSDRDAWESESPEFRESVEVEI